MHCKAEQSVACLLREIDFFALRLRGDAERLVEIGTGLALLDQLVVGRAVAIVADAGGTLGGAGISMAELHHRGVGRRLVPVSLKHSFTASACSNGHGVAHLQVVTARSDAGLGKHIHGQRAGSGEVRPNGDGGLAQSRRGTAVAFCGREPEFVALDSVQSGAGQMNGGGGIFGVGDLGGVRRAGREAMRRTVTAQRIDLESATFAGAGANLKISGPGVLGEAYSVMAFLDPGGEIDFVGLRVAVRRVADQIGGVIGTRHPRGLGHQLAASGSVRSKDDLDTPI